MALVPDLRVHPLSLAATPIEGWCGDHRLGHATGFISKVNGRPFLISNWHVFSGRDAHTGQPLAPHGGCPDRLLFVWHRIIGEGRSQMEGRTLHIRAGDVNLWLQHPEHGQVVDVAAIPLEIEADILTVDDFPDVPNMKIEVGQDVFIMGYPLAPRLTESFPIWKRGTIASEPAYKVGGLEQFLIDTATREGMSGALVVARSHGGYAPENGPYIISGGSHFRRIGIYSGRWGANDLGRVQLGVVWRANLIAEVCVGGKIGDFRLAE